MTDNKLRLAEITVTDLAYHYWKNDFSRFELYLAGLARLYPKAHAAILKEKAEIWEKMEATD